MGSASPSPWKWSQPHAATAPLTSTCCHVRNQQERAPKLSLPRATSLFSSTEAMSDPTGTDRGRAQQGTCPDTALPGNARGYTRAGRETELKQGEKTNSSSSSQHWSCSPRWHEGGPLAMSSPRNTPGESHKPGAVESPLRTSLTNQPIWSQLIS